MVTYDRRNASIKTASWDGPFAWWDDHHFVVYATMDSYGRVHHVTKDIKESEARLEKIRRKVLDVFNGSGLRHTLSEITIDGFKGSGRVDMIISFWVTWPPTEINSDLEAVCAEAAKWGIKDIKKPPR